ncbi:NAD(P)H-binding protein [Mesorhizobium atlanticum]|uniref:NmrA family transcriptional regulator n=1 Tax=Mesorhizobium atlanticum TaxID=2233532 RepID=A0A330GQ21_9HYPH|nr:NAD(P)H-binding protein [Mesorhizobium atlanticum]RAZ73006.1 NmrA family transcriptional regulator [Mesorhizobium atlanticum]
MILITGASGQLASQIVRAARQKGIAILTGSRAPGADRLMDFDRPETLNFTGIATLLMTSAGSAEDDCIMRRHGAVVAAARAQGVRQVVYTSLSHASDHLGFALGHRWTERELRTSGMAWTILRNGLYAELIGDLLAPRGGLITTPFGTGRVSAVARADLAQAAVTVLSDPVAHANCCYELSGTDAFSAPDLARNIGAIYQPGSFEDERARLSAKPLFPFQPPMLMSISSAAAAGFLETNATDLTQLVVPTPLDALEISCTVARAIGSIELAHRLCRPRV